MTWTQETCLICNGTGKTKSVNEITGKEEKEKECVVCSGKGNFKIWYDPWGFGKPKRWQA